MSIAENLEQLRSNMPESGNRPTIVAVSKMRSLEEILRAYRAGVRHFGENRLPELIEKRRALKSANPEAANQIVWHFIGHIQSRKARDAVAAADRIDAVDTIKLARRLDHWANQKEKICDVLVQVNISNEPQKYGFAPDVVSKCVQEILCLKNLNVRGLMGMASFTSDESVISSQFRLLRDLRDDLIQNGFLGEDSALSMGMSGDYRLAVEHGSTEIRVGSMIFAG